MCYLFMDLSPPLVSGSRREDICLFLCPQSPTQRAGPGEVGRGGTVCGSGNIECASRHVSLRKVHGQSVTIAAKAAF